MAETTASEIRRSNRVRELSRMTRVQLEEVERRALFANGMRRVWQAGRASKDELVSSILELEFPRARS